MEKSEIFIANTRESDRPVQKRILDELREDISLFQEDLRPIIEKFLRSEPIKELSERVKFTKARDQWWQEKYGFPYTMKTAREEVISRKYALSASQYKAKKLQKELLSAVSANNEPMIQEVKEKYISEFPEEIEGVTVIFEFVNFLNNGAYLKNNIERTPRRDQVFQELTEYQFLLTDFIRFNRDDKEFLNLFWIALENIAKQKEALQKLHSLRRSILSQVAVYCILEKLGKKPSIAHPAEDAFHAIDLWSDKENQAIQIEGTPAESPFIIETSEIGFPSVVIDGTKKQQKYFSTETATKFQKFKLKLDAYGREIHKDLKGYLLVVPYSKFDFVTGEPSDDIVEFMRSKITQNDDKHD